jgi:hypothetical protein
MRIGALGFVVPLWNPVRLSEEILFLHDATKGRLELGFVSGINDPAFEHYGVEWDTKGELFWQLADAVVEKIDWKVKTIWFASRDKNSIERAAVRGWSTAQWVQPKLDVVRTLFNHHRGYVTQAKNQTPITAYSAKSMSVRQPTKLNASGAKHGLVSGREFIGPS